MSKKFAFALSFGVSLASLATGSQALAQEAPQGDEASADEGIIVTARRRDESLQDVPQVVNAVSGESLEKLNIRKFEDVAATVPGLSLEGSTTGTSSRLSLRGVTFDSTGSAPPTVEFYVNDANVPNTFVFQSMYDIGQIEVLRGPQGTLRGRAAPSGSITLTTRRANLNEVGGYVNGSATSQGAYNVQGAVGAPIIPGKVAIRVAGTYDENELDHVRSVNNTVQPLSKTKSGRVSLRIEPIDAFSANISYQHLDRDQLTNPQVESVVYSQPSLAVAGTGPLIQASDRLGITRGHVSLSETQDLITGQFALRFGGQRLDYTISNAHWISNTTTPTDGAFLYPVELPQSVATRYNNQTHEVRLSSDERLFGLLDYTAGFFTARNISTNVVNQAAYLGGTSTYTQVIDTYQYRKETSFFGNLTFHLGDATELSGGVRRIEFKQSDAMYIAIPAFSLPRSPLFIPADQTNRKTIYNVSLSHRFSPDFMVYANTGSSFRGGPATIGVFRPYAAGSNLDKFLNMKPESSKSYEIGFKSTLLDRKLRLNVAAFHQDFDGYIYRGQAVNFINLQQGAEKLAAFNFQANVPAKVDGFEVELGYRANANFNLNASLAYANGKIKNGLVACNDLNGDGVPDAGTPTIQQIKDASGGDAVAACRVNQRLTFAPNWSLVLQPEYTRPVNDIMDGFVRALVTIYPDNVNIPTNAFDTVKGYYRANIYVGLRAANEAWELSAFVKNIGPGRTLSRSDTLVRTDGFTNDGFGRYVGASYSQPREFGLNLRYSFGSR